MRLIAGMRKRMIITRGPRMYECEQYCEKEGISANAPSVRKAYQPNTSGENTVVALYIIFGCAVNEAS